MNFEECNVLIVDDDEDIADLCADAFKNNGFVTVDYFTSPINAVEALHKKNYSVIVSDESMPMLSGLQFLKEVQKFYEQGKYLFYLVSGNVFTDHDDVRNLGIKEVVVKPYDMDKFVAHVKQDLELL